MKYLKNYGNCEGPFGFPMQEDDARDLDKMLETGEWSKFSINRAEVDGIFSSERSEISVISDNTVDKHGDVVDPKSINFDKFRRNPVVAYNHMYDIPPVGKSLWQKLVAGTTWKAKTQYISRPDDYPSSNAWFPSSVFHMIKEGTLQGKSIGGAVKWRAPTEEDIKTNPNWKSASRISEKALVWEYSVCPIAVNQNALVEQITKSMISLPNEILERDFPEVFKQVHELRNRNIGPVIGDFVTKADYLNARKAFVQHKIANIEKSIPSMVETAFKRLKGEIS